MVAFLIVLGVILAAGIIMFVRGCKRRAANPEGSSYSEPFASLPPANSLAIIEAEHNARKAIKALIAKNRASGTRLMWIGGTLIVAACMAAMLSFLL